MDWQAADPVQWREWTDAYWQQPTVKRYEALEETASRIWQDRFRVLSTADGFVAFLTDICYPWKFNPIGPMVAKQNVERVRNTYAQQPLLIDRVRRQLQQSDPMAVETTLKQLTRVPGLGIPAASGCLTLLYPEHYGTIDRFTLRAIRYLNVVEDAATVIHRLVKKEETFFNEVNDQTLHADRLMIGLYRMQAERLGSVDPDYMWTPRKVEMAAWMTGHTLPSFQS